MKFLGPLTESWKQLVKMKHPKLKFQYDFGKPTPAKNAYDPNHSCLNHFLYTYPQKSLYQESPFFCKRLFSNRLESYCGLDLCLKLFVLIRYLGKHIPSWSFAVIQWK